MLTAAIIHAFMPHREAWVKLQIDNARGAPDPRRQVGVRWPVQALR